MEGRLKVFFKFCIQPLNLINSIFNSRLNFYI